MLISKYQWSYNAPGYADKLSAACQHCNFHAQLRISKIVFNAYI